MSTRSAAPSSATPWIWLVPTLGCALAALVWLERERTPLANLPPTIASPDEGIAGFSARTNVAGGALRVRLTPLHPDAERQRFDALALAQRLELGAGAPWRLSLALDDAAAPIELDCARLVVSDRAGRALVPLCADAPSSDGAVRDDRPSDPLRVLIGATADVLDVAHPVDVVLWGRMPDEAPRLEGFAECAPLELERAVHRRAELETPLARLELAGKSADARASSEPKR